MVAMDEGVAPTRSVLMQQFLQEAGTACRPGDGCLTGRQRAVAALEIASVFMPFPTPAKATLALRIGTASAKTARAAKGATSTRFLRGSAGNAGPVPDSVAAALRGRAFTSPKQFREEFWRAVADDAELAAQFSVSNVTRMGQGLAPRVVPSQRLGKQGSYILHHRTPVSRGGAQYDPANILVVTPRFHKEVLTPNYHYGGRR